MTRSFDFIRSNARWLSAAALLSYLSSFGQTYFISVFAGEIQSEFDLGHAEWGGIYALGTIASAIVMIWAGTLSDRFRVRGLVPWVLAGMAAACLLMALNQSVWLLPVTIFLLRFTGQGMATHVSRVAVARWFIRARGRALAVTSMGFSLAEASLPLIIVFLMSLMGWRWVWVCSAVLLLIMIPILMTMLRHERTPQSAAEEPGGEGLGGHHWRRAEALRNPLFWMLVPSILAPSAFSTAYFFFQVHISDVKPWDHVDFVALIPLYTLVGFGSMMAFGWAVDRFGSWKIYPIYQLPMALAFLLLAGAETSWGLAIVFVLIGMMQGANATVPAALFAEAYGTRYLGGIKALTIAVMVLGSAIGPGICGALIDAGLPFPAQGVGICVIVIMIAALSGIGIWQARRRAAMG